MSIPALWTKAASQLRKLACSPFSWIFICGLGLRLLYLFDSFRRNELIAHPVVDAHVYVDWAREILDGQWLWYDARNYTPAFPLWLAGLTSLTGWHPAVHFVIFHVLGALQAVILAKTAESLWRRRVGLFTGWLAAAYWPLIVFEATYYAEAFAMFCLSLTLYLVVRWTQQGRGWRLLAWAGFAFGWSLLARANVMLCVPVFAGWIVWTHLQRREKGWARRSSVSLFAMLTPVVLLCLPVIFWHWKLTGKPGLRTGGMLSVYLGNNPEYRGLVVPVGVRWTDFVYQPIRADQIEPQDQSDYWQAQVKRVVFERTGDWLRLLGRKAVMMTGRLEVSQEIDIATFRSASRVLSWPVWPGWGTLAPLALFAILASWRSPDARRGLPLMLCAAAYFASIAPVQVSGRYRLPMLIPLAPLAGWAMAAIVDALRKRGARVDALAGAGAIASCVLIWPDWLGLRGEKIINHSFLVGTARLESGDEAGALAAFEAGAAWNPADADCPLRIARILLGRGDVDVARRLFEKSLANFPPGHDALLGLGECALAEQKPQETLKQVREALRIAPNNMDALLLASRAFSEMGDWAAMAAVCEQMRSYPTHPATVDFSEAWALALADRGGETLARYDAVASTPWFTRFDRARAAFFGGIVAWHNARDRAEALRRWKSIAAGSPTFFQPLAQLLTGDAAGETGIATLPKDMHWRTRHYVDCARGMKASLDGKSEEARRHFESIVALRDARKLPAGQREIIEIWAIKELDRPSSDEARMPGR